MMKILALIFVFIFSVYYLYLHLENRYNPASMYAYIPDVINKVPSMKYTATETIKFKRAKYGNGKEYYEALKGKDTLKIVKKNGQFYWKNQGGIPLLIMEQELSLDGKSKSLYTIFIAYDGSGLIMIRHDKTTRGWSRCNFGKKAYSNYLEYRVKERAWLTGWGGFFPPKPDDWCDLPNIYNN